MLKKLGCSLRMCRILKNAELIDSSQLDGLVMSGHLMLVRANVRQKLVEQRRDELLERTTQTPDGERS